MSPEDIKNLVESNKIILFTKGTKDQPMCGFSNHTIEVFNQIGKPFECIDIFSDPSVRPALVEYSSWPTTPQVFIEGELIGGCDITMELFQSGELQKKVEAVFAATEA